MSLFKRVAAVAMSALLVAASMPITGANAATQKITQLDIGKTTAAINGDGVYRIIGTGSNKIIVASDTTATITLANAQGAEMALGSDSNVTVLLSGKSKFQRICGPESSHITVSSVAGDGSTDGELHCDYGIGGHEGSSGQNNCGSNESYENYAGSSDQDMSYSGSHENVTNGGTGDDASSNGTNSGEITISGGTIYAHIGGGNGGNGGSAAGGNGLGYFSGSSYSTTPIGNGANGGIGGKGSDGGNSGLITITGGKIIGSVGGGNGGAGGNADGGDGGNSDRRAGGNGGNAGTGGVGGNGGNCSTIKILGGEIQGSVGGGIGGTGGSANGGASGWVQMQNNLSYVSGSSGNGGTSGIGGTGGKSASITIAAGTVKGSVGGGAGGDSGKASGGYMSWSANVNGFIDKFSRPGNGGTSATGGNGGTADSIIMTGGTVEGTLSGGFGGNSGCADQGYQNSSSQPQLTAPPTVAGNSGNSGNGAVCNSVAISGGKVTGKVGSGAAGRVGSADIWVYESQYKYYYQTSENSKIGAAGTDAAAGAAMFNGGTIDISTRSIPFTTTLNGKKGNAVVYTAAIPDDVKSDANTQGVLFEHVTGESYGSRGTVYGAPVIQQDATLPFRDASGKTTLLAISSGKQLTVNKGVTLINRSGSYTQAGGIKIAGTLINQGTIQNAGQVNKTGSGTLSKAAGSVYQVAAEMHTNYDGSCKGTNDIVQQDVWLTYGQTYLSSLPFLHRTGYSIVGWQDGSGNQMQANAVADDINPIQLYAQWAQAGCIMTTVTDAVTKKALKDVTVVSKNSSGKVVDTVQTDANGKAVTYLEDGSYTTEVTASGYEQAVSTSAKAVTVSTSAAESFALAPIQGSVTVTKINKITKKPMPVTDILITNKNGDTVYSGGASDNADSLTVPSLNGPDAPFAVSEVETPKGYRVDMTQYSFTFDKQGQAVTVQMESTPLTGSITVIVTNPSTGKPYPAGTEVVVKDDAGNIVGSGKTSEDGSVTIPDVPVGNVHITVPGYDSGDITANVTDGDTTNTTITATPIVGTLKVTNINAATNAALSVPTVTVKDKDSKTVFSGTTTDGMILTIPNLTAVSSPYTVTSLALSGYQPDGKTYTVNVTKNGQVSEIELHSVPKTSSATVVITNKDGSAAQNVPIVIKDSTGKVVGNGVTDNNGHVVIPDLPEGTYTVAVKDKDDNIIDTGKTLTVSVGGTNTVTAVDANQTHGSVDVSFTDPLTGKPVAGIDVVVKDHNGKVVVEGSTDENGNVHFPNLPEGDYTVVTKDKSGKEIGNGGKVTVTGGSTSTATVKNPAQIGGTVITVTDPVTKKPAANVPVVLKDQNGNIIAHGTTDKNGQVTFTNVAEGTYTAVVTNKDGNEVGKGQQVVIVGGKTGTASLVDENKVGNVDMTIIDSVTGKPLPNADVFLKDKDGKVVATGKTDENGHVVFKNVPVGDYNVTVSDSTGKVVIDGGNVSISGGKSSTAVIGKSTSSSSPSASSASSTSSSYVPVNPPVPSSSSSSSIADGKANITAKDSTGAPLTNIPLIVKDSTGKTVGIGTTDSSGKVTVPNLPDGTYTVSSGDSSVTLEGSITIANGQTASVTLKGSRVPTGNAKLLVLNTAGKPVAHFTLLIKHATAQSEPSAISFNLRGSAAENGQQIVAEITTDANGFAVLPQMPAGQYTVTAKDNATYKVNSSIAIVPSAMVAATVTATPVKNNPNSSKPAIPAKPAQTVKPVSAASSKSVAEKKDVSPSQTAKVTVPASVPKTGQEIMPFLIVMAVLPLSAIGLFCCRKKHSANK